MQNETEIGLTSAEISQLWVTYQSDSMSICIFKYFLEKVKDADVKKLIEISLSLAEEHIKTITDIFNKEGYPIPQGFTESDVNIKAPPLYDDSFILFYIRNMSRIGLGSYSVSAPQMSRPDVLKFFSDCLTSSLDLSNQTINMKLSKGLYVRPPIITIPDKIDYIKSRNFLTGFFGEKRAMTSAEITSLFINIQSNNIGKALLTGFAQVVDSEQVADFLRRGIDLSEKHMEIFSSKLENEKIPSPLPSDTFVTNSTISPFSDKLIMYHTSLMIIAGISNYATAMTTCLRHDLQADFVRLTAEIAKYSADGLNILIENGWMEMPPQAVSHAALSRS